MVATSESILLVHHVKVLLSRVIRYHRFPWRNFLDCCLPWGGNTDIILFYTATLLSNLLLQTFPGHKVFFLLTNELLFLHSKKMPTMKQMLLDNFARRNC